MNFVALIGIVNLLEKGRDTSKIELKIEKNNETTNEGETWYDIVNVTVPNELMTKENEAKEGDIVGIKGRLMHGNLTVLTERIQVF